MDVLKSTSTNEDIEERLEQEQLDLSNKEDKESYQDLAKEYIELEQEKVKVDLDVEQFKIKHQEIFDELQKIENRKIELVEQQNSIKSKLLDKLVEKYEVLGYSFVKVITEVKRTFDSKAFYKDYLPTSKLYKKYVTESSVEPYVRITKLKKKNK